PFGQELEDGGDDAGAARRAEREDWSAVLEHDGRGHARARALAARGRVRGAWDEVEVGELVVEQEPMARHDDAAPSDLLDREGVGDDVAKAVRDCEVRCGWHVERPWVTGRNGDRKCGGANERPALGGVSVREQALYWHVDEVRVAQELVAI